jgi:hypothetical protein
MHEIMSISTNVARVLRSISDAQSLELFKLIGISNEGISGYNLKSKNKLTRKQYYSRLSAITKAGLVKRKHGKYFLTTFGKVVYDSETTIENAFNNYWKLKAIDSIEVSNELPKEEYTKIVDALIDNYEIKDSLLGKRKANDKFYPSKRAAAPPPITTNTAAMTTTTTTVK